MEPGLMRNVIWNFFKEYSLNIELSEKKDENNHLDTLESVDYLLDAEEVKSKLKIIWGLNDNILTGALIYLDARDSYFNPKLNSQDSFFDKIYFNKEKLENIGKKNVKPKFPFDSIDNYDKKILLLR